MGDNIKSDNIKSGVILGDGFISSDAAKEKIINFIRRYVGPRKGMAPDLVFALDVIRQTIPKSVLTGEKLKRYNKAQSILWSLRDELCQIEATICMFWPDSDEVADDVREQ